jgi:hypothetical protein
LAGAAAVVAAPAAALARTGDPKYLEIAMPRMRRIDDTVWLGQLTPNVWNFTTTKILDGDTGYYPANGAIVVQGTEALIIDAGWLPKQAVTLLDIWKAMKKPPITKALATHFHSDRVGGIPVLNERGIPVYGNPLTIGLAIDSGFAPPKPLHEVEKHPVKIGNLEVFYPGPGHTIDNIVVSIPSDGVLFGGCLVKSVTANGLGERRGCRHSCMAGDDAHVGGKISDSAPRDSGPWHSQRRFAGAHVGAGHRRKGVA